jgi:hypothetical protein
MKDTNEKRLVMIGIRRKGEKRFKTRCESKDLCTETGLNKRVEEEIPIFDRYARIANMMTL